MTAQTPRKAARSRRTLLAFSLFLSVAAFFLRPAPGVRGLEELADDSSRISEDISVRASRQERARQLARLGVGSWHEAGWRGQGLKVAILDSGFRGYRKFLGKALPESVEVQSFREDRNFESKDSQHGILCGEVIHALAPEAQLLLANWEPDDPATFLDAVRWARRQGARIISCSVITPYWSDGDGGGRVHLELARLLGSGDAAGDLLCFASAGNTAQRHWSGLYSPGRDGLHAWITGATSNRIQPWSSEQVSVELYSRPGNARYELSIVDTATGAVQYKALSTLEGERLTAVIRFDPEPGQHYAARIRQLSGTPGRFHVTSLSADLEFATLGGSVMFPADGPEVIAVGAVDDSGQRMTYSSCGPNSMNHKPDIVAPVPFTTFCRERPFSGTSAAAPQAAALAALIWARNAEWSAARVSEQLRGLASDLGVPGPDFETGYGRIGLPRIDRVANTSAKR